MTPQDHYKGQSGSLGLGGGGLGKEAPLDALALLNKPCQLARHGLGKTVRLLPSSSPFYRLWSSEQ